VVGEEDARPWGRPAVPLCKCCGQPGANSFSDLPCVTAYAGTPQIAPPRLQFNPKLPDHELRLHDACGKERTGFPQVGAAQPSEIQHPVDPETRKRCYTFTLRASYNDKWDRLVQFVLGNYLSPFSGCFRPGSVAKPCGHRKAYSSAMK
jgi:hypothetical protein